MKPRINRKIYAIYRYQITEEVVKFLGEESFVVENYKDYIANYELKYDHYNKVWFTSLAKAKAKIKESFPNEKIKFKECRAYGTHTRFWNVE